MELAGKVQLCRVQLLQLAVVECVARVIGAGGHFVQLHQLELNLGFFQLT